MTLSGVQKFRYRGAGHVCLPGEVHVLHPDETHDGVPGGDTGFAYRIVYLIPELVSDAIGRLPFASEPVLTAASPDAAPLTSALRVAFAIEQRPLNSLQVTSIVAALTDGLAAASKAPHSRRVPLSQEAVRQARELLAADVSAHVTARDLEIYTGLDRYTLARQFRAVHGTTPDRFRLLRRLDAARTAIARGMSLANVAAEGGFADQSHLTRQFRATYGITPARWRTLTTPLTSREPQGVQCIPERTGIRPKP